MQSQKKEKQQTNKKHKNNQPTNKQSNKQTKTGKEQGTNIIKVLVAGHLYWMPLVAGERKGSLFVSSSSVCVIQQFCLTGICLVKNILINNCKMLIFLFLFPW